MIQGLPTCQKVDKLLTCRVFVTHPNRPLHETRLSYFSIIENRISRLMWNLSPLCLSTCSLTYRVPNFQRHPPCFICSRIVYHRNVTFVFSLNYRIHRVRIVFFSSRFGLKVFQIQKENRFFRQLHRTCFLLHVYSL